MLGDGARISIGRVVSRFEGRALVESNRMRKRLSRVTRKET